jgi:uncharacterized protein HemX
MTLAQIPGAEEAFKSAAQSGWTAVLVAIIVVAAIVGVGWLFRQLYSRQTDLEQFARSTLVDLHTKTEAACLRSVHALEQTGAALEHLTEALNSRVGLRQKVPVLDGADKTPAAA